MFAPCRGSGTIRRGAGGVEPDTLAEPAAGAAEAVTGAAGAGVPAGRATGAA